MSIIEKLKFENAYTKSEIEFCISTKYSDTRLSEFLLDILEYIMKLERDKDNERTK